ncbi:MAG: hypothetical protein O7D91_21445 [Planctomycetota bacterium]|nr:hypothetical protein [Planctomycetota bacterium]
MKVIRFRRFGSQSWEIAFSEQGLREKLDGDMAEIIMPAKPFLVRLWRRLFPLRGVEVPLPACPNDGKWHSAATQWDGQIFKMYVDGESAE